MNLNLRELIDGGPTRLRYVFRYSTCRVGQPESVAEHSYYVCLYALLIARWVDENKTLPLGEDGHSVLLANLLQRAILHDLEEAISGDFPRNFKHSEPELEKMLATASQKAFEQLLTPIIDPPSSEADAEETTSDIVDEYIVSWLDSKDGTPEGRILEFADFLAVLSFMRQEGAATDNRIIERHVKEMDKYFENFLQSGWDFIRPLVQQAAEMMGEMF